MSEDRARKLQEYLIASDRLRRCLFAIICAAIFAGSLFFVLRLKTYKNPYKVSTTFVVSSNNAGTSLQNLSKAQEISGAIAKVLGRDEVRKMLLSEVGGSSLNGELEADLVEETNLIQVSVTSYDLKRACLIMQAVVSNRKALAEYISGDVDFDVLVSPVIIPAEPAALYSFRDAGIFAAVVFAVLCAVVWSLSYLRKTVKSPRDPEDMFGLKCLSTIPKASPSGLFSSRRSLLISRPSVSFAYVESIGKLCRKIRNRMHGKDEHLTTLLVTSTRANEGKSTIAANIAWSLYDSGKKVLIMDLDFANPSIYKIFGVTEHLSQLRLFLEGQPVKNVVRTLESDGLGAVLNTEKIPETIDLVSSDRLKKLLSSLEDMFDYIIIDSPPVTESSDAEVIAGSVDCTLLVIRQDMAPAQDISDAARMLSEYGANLIGCVLNDAAVKRESGGYDYYSKYGRNYYGSYGAYADYYGKDA